MFPISNYFRLRVFREKGHEFPPPSFWRASQMGNNLLGKRGDILSFSLAFVSQGGRFVGASSLIDFHKTSPTYIRYVTTKEKIK